MSELRQNQWDESKHPRDEQGQFTSTANYDDFRQRRTVLSWKSGIDGLQIPKKKYYEELAAKMENAADLDYLPADLFGKDLPIDEIKAAIEKNKEIERQNASEAAKKKEAATAERSEAEKAQKNALAAIRKNTTATEAQAEKLIEVTKRAEKVIEQAVTGKRANSGSSGYVGKSKSVRATNAEAEGRFPATKAAQILGVSSKKVADVFGTGEWHHTGALYKETNYYDIADVCDIVSDLPYESPEYIRKTYSAASIENVEKLYGIKIN